MKQVVPIVAATVLSVLTVSCGSSPAVPSDSRSLNGAWSGMGVDSQGATTVTWALTQTGAAVSGTVKTQAVDPNDGSCNSCHRNKTGTISGTMAGTTLTMTMFFAAGGAGDPTPACTATLTGTATTIAANQLTGSYAGADSCEGPFVDGTLAMARQP